MAKTPSIDAGRRREIGPFEAFFDSHKARFLLAANGNNNSRPPPPNVHSVLQNDTLLSFLAPHDILSLWRCCKSSWEGRRQGGEPSQQASFVVMMRSVFSYLRISKEAADAVTATVQGGWKSFLPLLVSMCDHLAKVYGELEPDVAHRVYLAEQACFHYYSHRHRGPEDSDNDTDDDGAARGFSMGYLALHSLWTSADEMVFEPRTTLLRPAPTPEALQQVEDGSRHEIGWGGLAPIFQDYPEFQRALEEQQDELKKNCAGAAGKKEEEEEQPFRLNETYKRRLQAGLHPVIWLSSDLAMERREYALGIGKNLEQFIILFSSQEDGLVSHIPYALTQDPNKTSFDQDMPYGLINFLLFLCSEERPDVGIAIWCKRHGIEPFVMDKEYYGDWESEEDAKEHDLECWKDLIRSGVPPDPPYSQGQLRDAAIDFYVDALTSPLFGPADFKKYCAKPAPPPAAVVDAVACGKRPRSPANEDRTMI